MPLGNLARGHGTNCTCAGLTAARRGPGWSVPGPKPNRVVRPQDGAVPGLPGPGALRAHHQDGQGAAAAVVARAAQVRHGGQNPARPTCTPPLQGSQAPCTLRMPSPSSHPVSGVCHGHACTAASPALRAAATRLRARERAGRRPLPCRRGHAQPWRCPIPGCRAQGRAHEPGHVHLAVRRPGRRARLGGGEGRAADEHARVARRGAPARFLHDRTVCASSVLCLQA